ncbi:acyl-CoA dehydrogenase family protein [Pseudomonas aeruginosa]|uniref:acyl-CoA dehydrogenase family protein n=1 Tax=Pseudomonas aeruginosa TaxID=287 RepID=UPI000AC84608|nr:acyl-CoA dehydrogenase family protein [Pseudomonas aeruginosa]
MLDPTLSDWLDRQADALDRGDADPAALLPRLAAAGVLGVAVEERLGGAGGTLADAVERVAAVAARSLTAAFVFWGQRAFIEYLLQSPNQELRQRLLGDLLAGRLAGATGLSNAMKFLSGIEALQVVAHAEEAGWRLDGRLPWVTNLRSGDFVVAAAIEHGEGGKPFVLAIPEGLAGLQRSADLRLLGLQCSNTAALDLRAVAVGRDWLLPIHNGTFDLAMHAWYEPFERILELATEHSVRVSTPMMGERIDLQAPHAGRRWWREVVDSETQVQGYGCCRS